MNASKNDETAAGLAHTEGQASARAIESLRHPRRILVPIDFSENSLNGLGYAVAFAARCGAELSLVHVAEATPWPVDALDMQPLAATQVADAGERLADLAEASAPKIASRRISVNVRMGSPALEVCHEAQACGADLVIMSTHGYTGLKRVLFGGITDSVVRHAPCPVLVVRSHPPEGAHKRSSAMHDLLRILVPMDFSLQAAHAIQYAAGLAAQSGGAVSLVHVMTSSERDAESAWGGPNFAAASNEAADQLKSAMERMLPAGLRGDIYLRRGSPFAHIVSTADLHEVDLLVLDTDGPSGLGQLILGSTTERVMYHASCPVLILREPPK